MGPGGQEMLLALSRAGVYFFYASAMTGAYGACVRAGLGEARSLVLGVLAMTLLHGMVVVMSAAAERLNLFS